MVLYRLLVSIFALVVLLQALRRDGWHGAVARLVVAPPQTRDPHLWIHGASNGELASAQPVVRALRAARPDLAVLVTANSASGVQMVRGWALPGVTALPAPLDLGWVSRRVMARWRVQAHMTLEAELWPNRIRTCPGPVMLLGARLRPGTARLWSRLHPLGPRVLSRVCLASAQDKDSLARLHVLGLPEGACGPVVDLKALYDPPRDVLPEAALSAAFPRAATWLAASTHDGEDAVILAAHRSLITQAPDSRLILAPRHPRRGADLVKACQEAGFQVSRRSLGEPPDTAQVYLADTLGEMPLWYRLAGRVFIGGTLTNRGGHTPYEPAAFDCALIHGPDVLNFKAPFARLAKADAAVCVNDATGLAQALTRLASPQTQARAGAAAARALQQDSDLDGLLRHVLVHLQSPKAS